MCKLVQLCILSNAAHVGCHPSSSAWYLHHPGPVGRLSIQPPNDLSARQSECPARSQLMHQFQQRTAAALAVRPPARSMLVPRSTSLSPGGIAGAVVGSVVGALLIAFCVFPFIVRARRRRLTRHDDPGLAEMGQRPGGPSLNPQEVDDISYKRCSGSGPESAIAHDVPQPRDLNQKPQSALPQAVTVGHGLPSPVSSSPASPTDPSSRVDERAVSPSTVAAPAQSPVELTSKSRRGTVSCESAREASFGDSHGPPSRELTGITVVGITEEPESIDRPSGSPEHGHFPHLKETLRGLIHGRRSSHHRRDSKRSTQAGTDGARSPSVSTNDYLSQQPELSQSPSGLEIDVETPGLAWDYYHDPNLGIDLPDTYQQSAPIPTSASIAPSSPPLGFAPAGSSFPGGQIPVTGAGVAPSMGTGPITEGVYTTSSDSDATVTPGVLNTQSTLLQGKGPGGSLQRTDSFPLPTIVSDLPSPPSLQYTGTVPSGNPMEMMKPTNSAESAWMLEHELRMIQNSPQPPAAPVLEPASLVSVPTDGFAGQTFGNDAKPQFQSQLEVQYQSPYQSPPQTVAEHETQIGEETTGYLNNTNSLATSEYNASAVATVATVATSDYNANTLTTTSDYSTPPPSTGPSIEDTPDTRLTPYTTSPSPQAEAGATVNSHLMPSPGHSAGLSPSPNLSPAPSPGLSPVPSPGRSPARPPGGFVCDVCGAVKSSYHQFNHHRRYHDRPFPCQHPGCGRRFGTVTHLRRHVNDKHHKTRRFYCTEPGCDYSRQGTKSFPRKDNWKRHMLKKHSVDPQNATDEDYLGDDVVMDGP
ncbi:uncharacterized protein P884DRAFT_289462 [Thermothelomyces heterothallicus CBS 202.75]|uniref:uncharacterized protein n=1 Tax=Thermothelomyces heterothallicus CBS 202.75 TaxID=1149848 RepID=UPI0037441C7D